MDKPFYHYGLPLLCLSLPNTLARQRQTLSPHEANVSMPKGKGQDRRRNRTKLKLAMSWLWCGSITSRVSATRISYATGATKRKYALFGRKERLVDDLENAVNDVVMFGQPSFARRFSVSCFEGVTAV
jgi:hypothetical protein